MTNRRAFLGSAATALGAMPFAGSALAQTAATDDAAPSEAATEAPVPASSDYGASTANAELDVISLPRLEAPFREAVPEAGYVFVTGAKGDEWTLQENLRAMHDFRIMTHRLTGVSPDNLDLSVEILGERMPFPFFVAPMGAHRMVHEEGEVATARGAGMAGALYCSSGASNRTLEEIAQATTGPKWFQIYFNADEDVTRSVLRRARDAGYTAIVLTADALGPGTPDAFRAMGMPFRPDMAFGNHDPAQGGTGNFLDQKAALTPDDIRLVKEETGGLPVIVKGILRPEDVDPIIAAGADAIQVSNHGGRQIDGVPAAISALPLVARAVNGRVPIIMDSGIRRGGDVIRALAMGATCVAVGRPVMYGLGVGGAPGVASVLNALAAELRSDLLLAGAQSVSDLDASYMSVTGPSATMMEG
ncbi:histidine kinase [Palleronia sediminis]|uniref:Histidine kinase n=1 Tax=Palleronia sediminis TaxID=2547833 RepID=A0A4R6A3I4_9RHOB|nr:alpha-hydroxy-acid oxidizing protein [Palleronia sediminis]TDL78150.1 histidine kinase [Palleronia sediminis]